MITKEEFTKLVPEYIKWLHRMDNISDVLNISNMYEWDWIEYAPRLFESTLNMLFKEVGVDNIIWWIYDKKEDSSLQMRDKDGNEIPTDTIDDLWEIVKHYRK